jgi:hypothetical protein
MAVFIYSFDTGTPGFIRQAPRKPAATSVPLPVPRWREHRLYVVLPAAGGGYF